MTQFSIYVRNFLSQFFFLFPRAALNLFCMTLMCLSLTLNLPYWIFRNLQNGNQHPRFNRNSLSTLIFIRQICSLWFSISLSIQFQLNAKHSCLSIRLPLPIAAMCQSAHTTHVCLFSDEIAQISRKFKQLNSFWTHVDGCLMMLLDKSSSRR